jgi:hypothetical protein
MEFASYVPDVPCLQSGEIEMRDSFPAQGPPQYPGFHKSCTALRVVNMMSSAKAHVQSGETARKR